MTISLLNTTSSPNTVSKVTTTVDTLTGTLRFPSSIIDPVIQIQRASPVGFNYFYILEFGRYYYLKNVVAGTNGLLTISGHVDVLKSFDSQIRASTGIAVRQEFNWDLYLDDGTYKARQNPNIKIRKWPYEFNDFSYILTLAGNGN